MRSIWKYELETTGEQTIRVPALFNGIRQVSFKDQILKVDTQNDKLCMWCLVDLGFEVTEFVRVDVDRKINIFGTGHQVPNLLTKDSYIGTYQLMDGCFIGHVFVE